MGNIAIAILYVFSGDAWQPLGQDQYHCFSWKYTSKGAIIITNISDVLSNTSHTQFIAMSAGETRFLFREWSKHNNAYNNDDQASPCYVMLSEPGYVMLL